MVKAEINDRGDGIRLYNTSSTQSGAITVTDVDGSGTARSLNLLNEQFERYQVQVDSSSTDRADFYSFIGDVDTGAANTYSAATSTITFTGTLGMNREDIIGSKISYVDAAGFKNHAIITDMTETSSTYTITVGGLIKEGDPMTQQLYLVDLLMIELSFSLKSIKMISLTFQMSALSLAAQAATHSP